MKTVIYGASDDLIEIEGPCAEEYCKCDFKGLVRASDGTIARLVYNGTWDFEIQVKGEKFIKVIGNVGDDSEHTDEVLVVLDKYSMPPGYSDVLILGDGIEWVKIGSKVFKKN